MINSSQDLLEALANITLHNSLFDFKWRYVVTDVLSDGWLVQIVFERPDTGTGIIGIGRGRKEYIAKGSSVSGVVKTGWLLIELTFRHELMEGFRWRGCRIFNPHHNVEELAKLEHEHETLSHH